MKKRLEVLNVIDELVQEGMAVVLVTHEMKFAEEITDRVIFMGDGVIMKEDPPHKFFHNLKHNRTKAFIKKVGH